jgi:processive 1,2-diacylglycerol beta-glucosyltransferase
MGFGTGHNSAAKALACEFNKQPNVTAEVVDLLQLIPNSFHPLLQSGYHGMLSKFPTLYYYLYDWTHHNKVIRYVSSVVIEKMGWSIRKRLNQLIRVTEPTKIVTTHPFGLLMCPDIYEEIPTVGVVTDYELHPIWLARVPHVLCVPKKLPNWHQFERIQWQTGLSLIETGIPVNPTFYEHVSKQEACRRLGLSPVRPVVLVMGGGTGLGPLEQVVGELQELDHLQLVVLTGKNRGLFERLTQQFVAPHIRIEGYRTDVPLWMSAADLLITKPGGVTITEAIAKQLPMLLFEAFPGQEEANQQYLLHHRVAMITRPSTIRLQVSKLLDSPLQLGRMRERFEVLMSSDACQRIVKETCNAKAPILQTL